MGNGKHFDGSRFLKVAEHLKPHFSDEAFARAAIGRSYYAVFLPAKEIAATKGEIMLPGGGRDHAMVKQYYYLLTSVPRDQRDFATLQGWRGNADYMLDWPNEIDVEETARKAIELAINLLKNQKSS